MKIKCPNCKTEIECNEDTACGLCGRKIGHTRSCPIYRNKFIGGVIPNIYGGEDNKPIGE